MKFAKKPWVLLVTLLMVLTLGLYACDGGTDTPTPKPTPPEPSKPTIEKIEVTNSTTTVGHGDFVITAKCSPEGIEDTGFTVALDEPVMGVVLDGKTVKVHPGTYDGSEVKITVTSTADATKTAKKTFTVQIDESKIDYVDITTGEDLLKIGENAESLAKNYRLTTNVEMSRGVDGDNKLYRWNPIVQPFTGLLNGNGYSITALDMNGGKDSGFFMINDGIIKNIGFDNAEYQSRWARLGANSGIIAGTNNGGITNVFTNVPVATSSGAVGALVGTNNGYLVNSYALGVAYSNGSGADKAGVVAVNNGEIMGTVADKTTTELDRFIGAESGATSELNAKLLTSVQMQTEKTYTDMGWDDAWYFKNIYPVLQTPGFSADGIVKSITLTEGIIEVADYAKSGYQVNIKKHNAIFDDVKWELDEEDLPAGVAIDENGVITFDEVSTTPGLPGKFDGKMIYAKASLKSDASVKTDAIFTLRDDGYNSTTGIVVNDAQELYDTFFKTVDGAYFHDLSEWSNRAYSRVIKLGGDIDLPAPTGSTSEKGTMWSGHKNANWRGIGGTPVDTKVAFTGVFDGQGHAIKGIHIKIDKDAFEANEPFTGAARYDGNAAWGFFRSLGSEDGTPGYVRNLILKDGIIDCNLSILNGDRRYIGGIAQFFNAGAIENCLVDLEVKTSTNWAGMVVGKMTGIEKVNRARREGSTKIINTLAMGKISSQLNPGDGPTRPNVDPYAVAGMLAYPDGKGISVGQEVLNSYAMGEATDRKGFSCRAEDQSDGSFLANITRADGYGFISANDFQKAATFEEKGFDPAVWFYKDGFYPTLRYEGFDEDAQLPVPTSVEIVGKDALPKIYDFKGIKDNGIQLETKVENQGDKALKFTVDPAVAGVSVDNTGKIIVADTIADNTSVKVNVTFEPSTNVKGDSYTFTILNDGYDPTVGFTASSEQELHSFFFDKSVPDGSTVSEDVWFSRKMTRKLTLTSDIVLSTYANWPMVTSTFKGHIDGKGFAISGLNVNYVEEGDMVNRGYGFFKEISSGALIENLALKGNVTAEVKNWSNNEIDNHVAALASMITGGTVQNVLIDVNLKTNAQFNGKFVGRMTGGTIKNSIAMGTSGQLDDMTNASTGVVKNWAPYAYGAFSGKADGGTLHENCFALGVRNDGANVINGENQLDDNGNPAKLLGFSSRNGDHSGDDGKKVNVGFKTEVQMKEGVPFEGFDATIWDFVEGSLPTLKALA